MDPLIGILIFILSAGDDILAVLYVRRANDHGGRARIQAALISGLLTALICIEVVVYSSAWIYLIPNAFGSILGTYLAMLIDDRYPQKKARDDRGRYKKPVPASQAIIEIEKGL